MVIPFRDRKQFRQPLDRPTGNRGLCFACDHAVDHHALDRYVLAGSRNAKEFAAMCAMSRKTAKYLFPFTHHLVNHPMVTRETQCETP